MGMTLAMVLVVALIAEFYGCGYVRKASCRMVSESDVRRARHMILAVSAVAILAAGLLAVVTVWNAIQLSPFLVATALLWIVLGMDIRSLAKLAWILHKAPEQLVGMGQVDEYWRLIKKGNIEEAGKAVEEACRCGSGNPRAWLSMAFFAMHHMDCLDKAEECIGKAESLMRDMQLRDPETLAFYEACKGNLLAERKEFATALLHLKRALELSPTQERRDYVRTMERFAAQERSNGSNMP